MLSFLRDFRCSVKRNVIGANGTDQPACVSERGKRACTSVSNVSNSKCVAATRSPCAPCLPPRLSSTRALTNKHRRAGTHHATQMPYLTTEYPAFMPLCSPTKHYKWGFAVRTKTCIYILQLHKQTFLTWPRWPIVADVSRRTDNGGSITYWKMTEGPLLHHDKSVSRIIFQSVSSTIYMTCQLCASDCKR